MATERTLLIRMMKPQGKSVPLLCWPNGEPIEGQLATTLSADVDAPTTFTVTLIVGPGGSVEIEGEPD